MKKSQSAAQRVKFASKPTPLSDIPFFQAIAGKTKKQATSQQFASDLGEFFGSIPGMKEMFNKGNQQTTTPDCEECEQEYGTALIQIAEINNTINTLVRLAERLNGTEDAETRLKALFPVLNGLTADAERIVEDSLK